MNKVTLHTLVNVKSKEVHYGVYLPALCLELCGGGLTTQQTEKAMIMQQEIKMGGVVRDLQLQEVYWAINEEKS